MEDAEWLVEWKLDVRVGIRNDEVLAFWWLRALALAGWRRD